MAIVEFVFTDTFIDVAAVTVGIANAETTMSMVINSDTVINAC